MFLGLGAQKCASTWLYKVLATHPQVHLPAVKELDFFSYHYDRGFQWYERHFDGSDAALCTGEVSPSYFHDPAAPARVRRYRPQMRLLVTLRDPVDRAISNHKHEVRLGHFSGPDLSFEAGLANNPMYVEQGLYGKHLANWLEYFPREQIYVALMEDIRAEPDRVAREVFGFLGIDTAFESSAVAQRFNASFATRSESLTKLKDRLYQWSRSNATSWLWSAAAGIGARGVYRRLNVIESDSVIPSPRPETLRELRELFAEDIRELETLLGRDLSQWRCRGEAQRRRGPVSGGVGT